MLIAQITDTHITRHGPQAALLEAALAAINALHPRPEVVLLSGDTTDTGAQAEYVVLRDVLTRCAVPVYVVPGNHDARRRLWAELPRAQISGRHGERVHFAVAEFAVRIIGLDTTLPGWPGGTLRAADVAWLDTALNVAPAQPTLLFMHHPPFRTGVNAADAFGFRGLRALRSVVARHPAVRHIIAGHIHCVRRTQLAQATVTTGISTAHQRVPEVFERRWFALRREPAGFTTHAWLDGRFVSTTYASDGDGRFAPLAAG